MQQKYFLTAGKLDIDFAMLTQKYKVQIEELAAAQINSSPNFRANNMAMNHMSNISMNMGNMSNMGNVGNMNNMNNMNMNSINMNNLNNANLSKITYDNIDAHINMAQTELNEKTLELNNFIQQGYSSADIRIASIKNGVDQVRNRLNELINVKQSARVSNGGSPLNRYINV